MAIYQSAGEIWRAIGCLRCPDYDWSQNNYTHKKYRRINFQIAHINYTKIIQRELIA